MRTLKMKNMIRKVNMKKIVTMMIFFKKMKKMVEIKQKMMNMMNKDENGFNDETNNHNDND